MNTSAADCLERPVWEIPVHKCDHEVLKVKRLKIRIALNSLRATGRHLSYGITQCCLLPDTSERTLP